MLLISSEFVQLSFYIELIDGRYHVETNSSLICPIPGHNSSSVNASMVPGDADSNFHVENGTRGPELVALLAEQSGVPVILQEMGFVTYDDCSGFFECWFKHPWTKVYRKWRNIFYKTFKKVQSILNVVIFLVKDKCMTKLSNMTNSSHI